MNGRLLKMDVITKLGKRFLIFLYFFFFFNITVIADHILLATLSTWLKHNLPGWPYPEYSLMFPGIRSTFFISYWDILKAVLLGEKSM